MEKPWHRNPDTEKIGRCRASKEPCSFGVENHFPSEEKAWEAEAKAHGGTMPPPLRKKQSRASVGKATEGKSRTTSEPAELNSRRDMEAFKVTRSQLCCPKCTLPVSQLTAARLTYGMRIRCRNSRCASEPSFGLRDAYVVPKDHALPIILDPTKIGERSWTHMTMIGENWHSEVSAVDGLVIHAGDYEAAADRMLGLDEAMSDDTLVNVFTLSFKEPNSLRVMEPIGDDMNTDILQDMKSYDAAVYVNRWEAPGTISIEANPRAMKVDRMELITMGELRKRPSFCNIPVADIIRKRK